jgi:hypothetical protein
MNQRTRVLLIALAAIGVLWMVESGYRNFVEAPATARQRQIDLLDEKIIKARERIVESRGAREALEELERLSLPYDPELARARYQDWLLDLVQSVQLTGASVDASKPTTVSIKDRDTRKPREIFTRYNFSLRGRGTLQQVSRFLHHFYQAGHLHKIGSITLSPVSGGRMIDFGANIEALALTRCERKGELSGESVQRLASSDFSDYQSIARRNLFARHGDKTLTEIVLSAITIASNGTPQAWFAVGGQETQVLKRGDTLDVPAHVIEVVDIIAGQVLLDVNGQVVTLKTGEAIEQDDESATDETAENRGAV